MSNWIEEVKSRIDLVSIVGRYTTLRRAGREFKGLCPFHQERTPSFYVVPDKGFYKCFGCGESGDAFSIMMKLDAIDFMEAARRLAAEYGVEVQERTRKHSDEERLRIERQRQLTADPVIGVWRALGIDDVAETFGIGRVVDESGESLLLPVYDRSDVPSGWLRYRVRRSGDGGVGRPERLGLEPGSATGTEDTLFAPKDLRTQLVRRPLIMVEDPLLAVRIYAAGWGAVVAPVRAMESDDEAPALSGEYAERLARLGCKSLTFVIALSSDRERRHSILRALHAAEPVLVQHGIEPLLLTEGQTTQPDSWTWLSEAGTVETLQTMLDDPSRTLDLFQVRVGGVQQLLARRRLSRAAAAEKLRPTLQAALAAEDRILYHAYLAWAGRALGVRDRRELYRLVQVNPPAAAVESEVF